MTADVVQHRFDDVGLHTSIAHARGHGAADIVEGPGGKWFAYRHVQLLLRSVPIVETNSAASKAGIKRA
jgi:hypothetical protein